MKSSGKTSSSSNVEKIQKQTASLFRKWDTLHNQGLGDSALLVNNSIRELRIMLCHCLLELMQGNPLEHGTNSLNLLWEKLFYPHFTLTKKLKKTKKSDSNLLVMVEYRNVLSLAAAVFRRAIQTIYFEFTDRKSLQFILPFLDAPSGFGDRKADAIREISQDEQKWATQALFLCLVHLGDIYRYHLDLKEEHYKLLAQKCYNLANMLKPKMGLPYNALGNLDTSTYYGLAAVYNYLQALTVEDPFLPAGNNLEVFLNRSSRLLKFLLSSIQKSDDAGGASLAGGKSSRQKKIFTIKQFIHRFMALVHRCTFPNSVHSKMDLRSVSRDVTRRFGNLLIDVNNEQIVSVSNEVDRGSPVRLTTNAIHLILLTCMLTLDYYSRHTGGSSSTATSSSTTTAAATATSLDNKSATVEPSSSSSSSFMQFDNETFVKTKSCLFDMTLTFGVLIMEKTIDLLLFDKPNVIHDSSQTNAQQISAVTSAMKHKKSTADNQAQQEDHHQDKFNVSHLRRKKLYGSDEDLSELSEGADESSDNEEDGDDEEEEEEEEDTDYLHEEDYNTTSNHYGIDPNTLDVDLAKEDFCSSTTTSRSSSPVYITPEIKQQQLRSHAAAGGSEAKESNFSDKPKHFNWADASSGDDESVINSNVPNDQSKSENTTQSTASTSFVDSVNRSGLFIPISSIKEYLNRMKRLHSIRSLLACVKLLCDWRHCHPNDFIALQQSPSATRFWICIVKIANILLPLTSISTKLNHAGIPLTYMHGEGWPIENQSHVTKHSNYSQVVPLPEDRLIYGTHCFTQIHDQLNTRIKINNCLEESILRVEALVSFVCWSCASMENSPIVFDEIKHEFDIKKDILFTEDKEMPTPIVEYDSSVESEETTETSSATSLEKKMEMMRQMAKLRLQNEVSHLEKHRGLTNSSGNSRQYHFRGGYNQNRQFSGKGKRYQDSSSRKSQRNNKFHRSGGHSIHSSVKDNDLLMSDENEEINELVPRQAISTVYLVPDTYAIMNSFIKKLLSSRRFVIVVPQTVVNHLDCLKKDNAAARNASRFLECKRGNEFIRVQQKGEQIDEEQLFPNGKTSQTRVSNFQSRWYQIIRCAAYCNEHYRPKPGEDEKLSNETITDDFVCILTDRFVPPLVADESASANGDPAAAASPPTAALPPPAVALDSEDVDNKNLYISTDMIKLANRFNVTIRNIDAFQKMWH